MQTRIYLCPADRKYGCSWEGVSDDILDHFSQEHEDLLFFTGSVPVSLEVASENRLILVDGEIYLLQTKINEEQLSFYLRYLGPAKIASNLTYEIDISVEDRKVGKQDVKREIDGFSVSLEFIYSHFGNVHCVICTVVVAGDFTYEPINLESAALSISTIEEETSSRGSTPDLQQLFATPKGGNSPEVVEDTNNRNTWNGPENLDLPKERSLNRSLTLTLDDLKKHNNFKRNASIRSLQCIQESDIDLELKCSNCNSHLAPPIFLCEDKHNICTNCYRNNINCTVCNQKILAIRNEDLEMKCHNHSYMCVNKKNGCSYVYPFPEILDHEINCMFSQFICPIAECGNKAPYKQMHNHITVIHSSVKIFTSMIAVFQKYQELVLEDEIKGIIFYCTLTQRPNDIIWKAKFCGPKARKFFCELKFKGKNLKKPLMLKKEDDCYCIAMTYSEMKEQKLKPKYSILTIAQ